jgi:hypothetical protein
MIPHSVCDDILMLKLSSSHHITDCHVGGIKSFFNNTSRCRFYCWKAAMNDIYQLPVLKCC